ncbi:MAG: rhomboid family intramembrane serine protease [Saprospiraceae bacterium]|nr:rhomboid family intramembrane serine protease [Saprospiraceae bacterium]MBP9211095.1 rhomboid family intramembrane serine protease [Saprospiraceae bacterium]MBV6472132.1 hypothetical protein [Saprospiraceae bacterium]
MFASIIRDVRYKLQTGGFWVRTIALSAVVFVMINLIKSLFSFVDDGTAGISYYDVLHSVAISSNWRDDWWKLWTWVTHVFVHEGFFHLLWNMLWLYWLSSIVEDFIGRRHAISLFFQSAIAGAFLFVLTAQWLPWYRGMEVHAIGASAAVNGLLFAAAAISPNYTLRLLLIGNVQIKYLAVVVLLLDLLFAGQQSNSGGHFAHLGGATWGYLYIILLRKGYNLRFPETLRRPKPPVRTFRKAPPPPKRKVPVPGEDRLNKILDKIHQQGMESLTQEERDFLDRASQQ